MERVRIMASQLLDPITWHQLAVAESALKLLSSAELGVDRASNLIL